MANKIIQYAKANPGKTALFAGVGIFVIFIATNGKGGEKASAAQSSQLAYGNSAYTDGMMQYGVQMAQIQAQQTAGNNQLSAQLEALNIQSRTELQSMQMQTETQTRLAEINRAGAIDQIGAAVAMNQDTLAVQYQIAQLQSLENMHAMDTSAQVTQMQLSSQVEALNIQAGQNIAMNQAFVTGQVSLASINADVTKHGLDQTTKQAEINADVTKYIAGKQASAAKNQNKWGGIGSIVGGALSLFCDVNIKTIDGCVSKSKCLDAVKTLPLEKWRYIADSVPGITGDDRQHVGTYAQDFYRALGVDDADKRTRIDMVDVVGVMLGALQEVAK